MAEGHDLNFIEVAVLHLSGSEARATVDFEEPILLQEGFTLEFWFKPDLAQATMAVLSIDLKQDEAMATNDGRTVSLWVDDGKLMVNYANDLRQAKVFGFASGTDWCHIAIVCHRGNMTAFTYNQTQRQSGTSRLDRLYDEKALGLTKIELGMCADLGPAMPSCKGSFAELRVWNQARTDSTINDHRFRRLIGNEPGLAGYWMLDEGDGDFLLDISINDNGGIIRDGDWEEVSNLELMNGWFDERTNQETRLAEAQIDYIKQTKLPFVETALQNKKKQIEPLEATYNELQLQLRTAESDYEDREETTNAELADRQHRLESRLAEISKLKQETLKRLEAARKIMLGDFIERLQDDLAVSRSKIAKEHGNVYGLDSVAMEVKMAPGYAGIGLQLPQPGMKTEASRLSTVTVQFKARPKEEQARPKRAPVPRLEGCTEIFARRKVAEAGFKVDVAYEAIDSAEKRGRVLAQLYDYDDQHPNEAKLDSVITLVVGQRS